MPSRDVLLNDRNLQISDVALVEDALSGGVGSAVVPVLDALGNPITLARVAATLGSKRSITSPMDMYRGVGSTITTRNGIITGLNLNSNGDASQVTCRLHPDTDTTSDATIIFSFFAVGNNGGPNPLRVRVYPIVDGVDVDVLAPLIDVDVIRNAGNAGTMFEESITVPAADIASMGAGSGVIAHINRDGATGNFALIRADISYTLNPALVP